MSSSLKTARKLTLVSTAAGIVPWVNLSAFFSLSLHAVLAAVCVHLQSFLHSFTNPLCHGEMHYLLPVLRGLTTTTNNGEFHYYYRLHHYCTEEKKEEEKEENCLYRVVQVGREA